MKHCSVLLLVWAVCACGGSPGSGSGKPDEAADAGDPGQAEAGQGDSGQSPGEPPRDASADAAGALRVEATIESSPTTKLRAGAAATFTFQCDASDCSFECAWDDGDFAACTSPASRSELADGAHTFRVRAVHEDASERPIATASFEVDARAPTVTFDAPPAEQSDVHPSKFTLGCSESGCSFECSLDAGDFEDCSKDPSFAALAPGDHTLKARARDAVGNLGVAATHTWTLAFGFRSLAVADTAACAVSGARKLYCWGSERNGLLGDGIALTNEGSRRGVPAPARVGSAENWDSVVAGTSTICALNVQGERYCWGHNTDGQFGDASVESKVFLEPTRASTDFPILSLGDEHGCAIDDAAHLKCWGDGDAGRLGDGDSDGHSVLTPLMVGTATWRAVSAGNYHTCAVRNDGGLYCFGDNESGACGQPETTAVVPTPTQVGSDTDWSSVAAGSAFTCARKRNGAIYCWGANWSGQLANGTRDATHTPQRIGTATDWVSISSHDSGACAIQKNGRAYCWGNNDVGQIGSTEAGLDTLTPVQVAIDRAITGVFGTRARCALTVDDQVLCWGDNADSGGALGRGIKGTETELVAVDSGYTQISLSGANSGSPIGGGCGIKEDGKLYCWGLGYFVGLPSTMLAITPTLLSADSGWTAVDVLASTSSVLNPQNQPYGHACGIRSGELSCWGPNGFGQLGLGDTANHRVPTVVSAVADTWRSVSVGTFSTCGITTTKKLYCWGRNMEGQLGQGDSTQRTSPTQVGNLEDWDHVAVNGMYVVAHRENGTVWHWGASWNQDPSQADAGSGQTATTDWVDAKAGAGFWCGIKASGAMYCRTSNGAVQQVSGVDNMQTLFKFDTQVCGKRSDDSLRCIYNNGGTWQQTVPPYPVAPSGTDWQSYEVTSSITCGLKTNGQRVCSGGRRTGNFGDGFDERIPAAVVLPP
jgi:alpha-tubulin suppressor-like RCC1 family protein